MEVVRVALTDQHKPVPNIRTRTFFIVKDRLDAAGLKNALDKLIREHWRKLGGRIVLNAKTKKYEYHIPEKFADGHEIFKWSLQEKDGSIEKAAPALLKTPAADALAFLPPVSEFDAEFRPADWPYHVSDEPADSPILFVHVSLYDDASVIALSLPHVVGDQLGTATLVRAWLGVMAGQEPPPLVNEDLLPNGKEFADLKKHEVKRKGQIHVRRKGEYFFVILGFIPDLVIYKEEQHHILFIPHSILKPLRQRVVKELEKYGGDPGISDGDVLTGLFTKFSRLHKKSPMMVTLSQSMNLRGRTPQLSPPKIDGFIHNAITYASSHFRYVPDMPLSEIAYLNRKAIQDILTTPGAADVNLAIAREMVRRGQGLHICEMFERSYAVTSWAAAWKGLDFTSAVEQKEKDGSKPEDDASKKPPELFVLGDGVERATPHRFYSTVMFRNDDGYWVDFGCSKKNFAAIQAHLATDPKLENL